MREHGEDFRPRAPIPPYAGYLERLAETIERNIAEHELGRIAPSQSSSGGATEAQLAAVRRLHQECSSDVVALSHRIHGHPELGFHEKEAVGAISALLTEYGYRPQSGVYGLDTAVHCVSGLGRPRVAFLAEYDALPDIGHACGHNIIGAAAVGAYLAVAPLAESLGGSVELLGTPAEEGGCGKEYIARAGGFDDVDAALMIHPFTFDVAEHPGIGARQVRVEYRGLAAHAAGSPFLGRNALDAVVHAYQGVQSMRQHMLPSDRVHGVITNGGGKPNVVPEEAAAEFMIRSALPETLSELSERMEDVFAAAAKATATTFRISWDETPPYMPVRNNRTLVGRFAQHLSAGGRRLLPPGVVPVDVMAGSTDLGNVSVRVPAIHPTIAVAPPSVSTHHSDFTAYAVSEAGDRGLLEGALGLALTAADYLADEGFRSAVQDEFVASGGVVDVEALLG